MIKLNQAFNSAKKKISDARKKGTGVSLTQEEVLALHNVIESFEVINFSNDGEPSPPITLG